MRPKVFSTIVAAFVTLFGLGNSAQADVVIEMVESTTGVTIIGSGSLQTLAGLTLNTAGHSPGTVPAQFQDFGTLSRILGGGSNDSDWYDTTFTTYTATTGGLGYGLNSSSAAISVGYFNPGGTDNRVYLPPGYAAGDSFSWTGFRAGATLASLNHSDGDTWGATWNTGAGAGLPATEGIQFIASVNTIPEPASSTIIGLGIGMVCFRRRSRDR